jgi:hypothetical protein
MGWLALTDEEKRRRRLRKRGACMRCGERAVKGKLHCQVCLDRAARSERERYEPVGKQKRCFICGELGHNRMRHRRPL